jgi:transglutaminase-like putative cysteine protease
VKRRATIAPAPAIILLALIALPGRTLGASLPDWLVEAGHRATAGVGRAHAVVLHDEQIVAVPAHGRTVTTTRRAIRIVTREATDDAVAWAGYARGTSEVRSLKAWTLDADGKVARKWERKEAVDVSDLAAGQGQLYTDLRHLVIQDDAIEPGQTFAWESVIEEEPLFAQWQWWFQSRDPCALSRFELHLPEGLAVRVRSAHLEAARTATLAGVWSWEMHDLSAAPREPFTPERPDLGPYLCVEATPSAGDRSAAGLAFHDWPALARWTVELAAPQSLVTPPLAATAAGLAPAAGDSLARIVAIARYVQRLNYVAINLNIGRGWGYRPHEAATVLGAGYGDCKDKANLLCTLLRATGHEAWLLTVYSGDRDRVDSAWASPGQFNHCIVAIRMPATWSGPTIAARPGERLLPFDPTDPLTAFGDLPDDQQGSWGLLAMPGGDLVRLPVLPPAQYRFERRIDAALSPEGRLSATLVERSRGQSAREERSTRRGASRAEYQGVLEKWLPAQGGNVAIRSWATREDTLAGRFELVVEYDSPSFARNVADRVLTFRSALVSPRRPWAFSDSLRRTPIAIPAICQAETVAVRLPEAFALDERPEDVHMASDLGRLDATWQVAGGVPPMVRHWEMSPVTVGPERWADVRALFAARRSTNEATVVLTGAERAGGGGGPPTVRRESAVAPAGSRVYHRVPY